MSYTPEEIDREFGFESGSEEWFETLRAAITRKSRGRIGRYVTSGVIRRGGQGVVYQATDPRTGQVVALKRSIAGAYADDRTTLRFARELELVQRLDHPGIVQVHGLESLDDTSWISMEWVDGVDCRRWAFPDDGARSEREVLELAANILDALQHAHERGVLHRDLKPSNVLVDREGRPRILDFGVGTRFDPGAPEPLTRSGEFLGTLAYASPEQVLHGSRSMDVRSDVHAIGALLYEMLTGRPPLGRPDSLAAAVRAVQEDRVRPVSRMRSLAHPDLDAVLAKALAKSRARRYVDAAAFREDLLRLLAGHPVKAERPRLFEPFEAWIGCHRAFFFTIAVLTSLLVGFASLAWMSLGASQDAFDAERVARQRSLDVLGFLEALFADVSPYAGGEPASLAALLRRATSRVESTFADDALMRSVLFSWIGQRFDELGHPDLGLELLERSLALREDNGASWVECERARATLAKVKASTGEYERARELLEDVVSAYEARGRGDDLEVGHACLELADLASIRGNDSLAYALLGRAEGVLSRSEPPDPLKAELFLRRSTLHANRGDRVKALEDLLEALALLERVRGETHPEVAEVLVHLAAVHCAASRLEESGAALERAREIIEFLLPATHPLRGRWKLEHANLELRCGRVKSAEEAYETARLVLARIRHGANDHHASALHGLCIVACERGDLEGAEDRAREAVAVLAEREGGSPRHLTRVRSQLADILLERVRAEGVPSQRASDPRLLEARSLYQQAWNAGKEAYGPDDLVLLHPCQGLGALGFLVDDEDSAVLHYSEALRILALWGEEQRPEAVVVHANLGTLAARRAKRSTPHQRTVFEEALRRFDIALARADSCGLPEAHPDRLWVAFERCEVLGHLDRGRDALRSLEALGAVRPDPRSSGAVWVLEARLRLARFGLQRGDLARAESWLEGAVFLSSRLPRCDLRALRELCENLGGRFAARGEMARAEHWRSMVGERK